MNHRLEQIVKRFQQRPAAWEIADKQQLNGIFQRIAAKSRTAPPVVKMADYLGAAARELPVRIQEYELIVGSDIYEIDCCCEYGFFPNGGHYSADYRLPLQVGLGGMIARIDAIEPSTPETATNRKAMLHAWRSLSLLIERYADEAANLAEQENCRDRQVELRQIAENCRRLILDKPETFHQALQLTYFIQIFLHLEGLGSNSMSFGRLDQFLYPFYRRDRQCGRLTVEQAEELWMCFAEKVSYCDCSQNLVLGGYDTNGREAGNELSCLIMRAQAAVKMRQPSLSLRVTPQTGDEAWAAALTLAAGGFGMPSFFNDPVVIKALENTGAEKTDACHYAIIGCYEANVQGCTYGQTTALELSLPAVLLDFLKERQARQFDDFDTFLAAWKQFFIERYEQYYLPGYQLIRERYATQSASPFLAGILAGCGHSGRLPEHYGAKYNWFGLNILGFGTLADSFYVIKKLVFDTGAFELAELIEQVRLNFPDESFYQRCRNLPGKYGTGNPESDELARGLSGFIAQVVLPRKLNNDVQLSPSLFRFLSDVYAAEIPATPDGRRLGERVSYGAAPTESAGATPTSLLRSAANLRTDLYANGTPISLTFPPELLADATGRRQTRSLIEAFFAQGGFHLQLSLQDADILREARACPEQHRDLLIRISGHSNYFVVLDDTLQQALIERAALGR